ncbi:MAG: NB-ARC domain-containing protein, partial [Rubrobacteraceae bacterium]
VVDQEVRAMGFAEAMISDKLDELFARTEGLSPTGGRRDLLPPPPGMIFGRVGELRAAKRALDPSTESEVQNTVVAVHGWPGVGKSTFLSELCNDREVLEWFPGGVFFVPVGRSSDARRLAEQVCAALEVPALPGATLEALKGRIANALSQRRILLVFDDVYEERHVTPLLLAGPGSAALVATRRLDVASRLSTAPEGALKIGLLSEEDSLGLLRFRAPGVTAEYEEACRDLTRALDGLPLALRVAADLLRVEAESGFDVSELLVELAEAARVLDEEAPPDVSGEADSAEGAEWTVRALLRKSLERMDEDLVRRFARLGVLPPKPLSFGPWAAADMWRDSTEDLPEEEQSEEEKARDRAALRELVRRGLVESVNLGIDPLAVKLDLAPKRPERFWMHALVVAFALEMLERTEVEGGVREAQQRRLEHYRRIAGAADGAMGQGGDTQLFGVFLITLDLPNIRTAHEWAREQAPNDRRALEYLSRLVSQGSRPLAERLGPEEWLEWMRLAEDAARRLGDEDEARYHEYNVGAALVRNGLTEEAYSVCLDNLDFARRNRDAVAEASTLANLAIVHRQKGEHEDALDYARRAEEAAHRADSPSTLAGAISQQATALIRLGRVDEAEERYEAMGVFAWQNGELSQYAKALLELAKIKRGRPEDRNEARGLFEEAAEVFHDLREHDQYRLAVTGLGVLENEDCQFDEAEEVFERTLRSAINDGDKGDQARAKMHLGIVHRYRGEPGGTEAAETEFQEALPLAASSKDGDKLGDVLLNLAWLLYEDRRDLEGARRFAEGAAQAYANVQSEKKSWAKDLIREIDSGGAA